MAIRNWPPAYIVVLWIFVPPVVLVVGTTLLIRLAYPHGVGQPPSGGSMTSWPIPESWVVAVIALALAVPGLVTLWWWRTRGRG